MQPVGKDILLYKLLKVPAVKGLSAASVAVVRLIILSHHAQVFKCVGVGYLHAIIIERRQVVVRPGVEAHHLRFVCIYRQRFPVDLSSEPVEPGLQLDTGQEREFVSKQQFWDSKIWSTSKCALYPFSQTVNFIEVDRKNQGERVLPCFTPNSGCTLACLSPSSSVCSTL